MIARLKHLTGPECAFVAPLSGITTGAAGPHTQGTQEYPFKGSLGTMGGDIIRAADLSSPSDQSDPSSSSPSRRRAFGVNSSSTGRPLLSNLVRNEVGGSTAAAAAADSRLTMPASEQHHNARLDGGSGAAGSAGSSSLLDGGSGAGAGALRAMDFDTRQKQQLGQQCQQGDGGPWSSGSGGTSSDYFICMDDILERIQVTDEGVSRTQCEGAWGRRLVCNSIDMYMLINNTFAENLPEGGF